LEWRVTKRALVVDNDPICVEIVGDILRQEGYEVAKAYDGLEAMEALEGELPDVVILDIVIPKIDGDRVLQYMRGNPRTSRIPVVILSGILVADRERVLAMRADAYVAKGPKEDMRRNLLAALQRVGSEGPSGDEMILGLERAFTRQQVKELLAVKRHKEAFLKALGEGVVEADGRQRVVYLNPAALEILKRDELELIGTPLAEILSLDHRTALEEAIARLRAGRGKIGGGLSLRYRDRILCIAFAWIVPEDPESGFFLILKDITDLARKIEELSTLNARLQEMERMRAEFLAMISHDLHTPLTAIKGSLDVLLHEGTGLELGRELLEIAQKNADRLFHMVNDILDLARIEAGRFEIRLGPFDVVLGLQGALERLRGLAEDKGIALTLDAANGLPQVSADGARIDQVFTNLLGNALKFTPPGGRISVVVGELPKEVRVEVRDTGVGIPPEHLDRIFDRFYRPPSPGGEQVEGAGLGLSICKAIVEEHGGRIWVESQPGRGSTFAFTLPKSPPAG
jgi:PAS domain S-box-containing protein